MDKKITNTKIKLLKLLIICFSVIFGIFDVNAVDPSGFIEYQDRIADQTAILGVKSLSDFAQLPAVRKKRLNSVFVRQAEEAHTFISAIIAVSDLKELLAISKTTPIQLKPSLKEDLTKALMILDPFNSIPPDLFLDNPKLHISTPGFGSHIMSVLKSDKAENAGISLEGLYKALSSDAIGVLKCSLASADDYASALGWLLFQHNSTYDYLCAIKGLLYSDGTRSSENDFHLLDSNFIFPVFKNLIKNMIIYTSSNMDR